METKYMHLLDSIIESIDGLASSHATLIVECKQRGIKEKPTLEHTCNSLVEHGFPLDADKALANFPKAKDDSDDNLVDFLFETNIKAEICNKFFGCSFPELTSNMVSLDEAMIYAMKFREVVLEFELLDEGAVVEITKKVGEEPRNNDPFYFKRN